jgi:UDP-N-acetylglucosamine/UDP-N-acetylgalactosamine diphosphorylase
MLKKLWKKWGPNPLDRQLKKAARRGCTSVLIPWNRGLGDIALGLYAIAYRVRQFLPSVTITFLTRPDLQEGFWLLPNANLLIAPEWSRGKPAPLPSNLPSFDLILHNADPTHWVTWQRGHLVPQMAWQERWDELCEKFNLPTGCIAAHVSCETNYYFERNWPSHHWEKLFASVVEPIILLGHKKEPVFSHPNIIDLRGETSLLEILSILKNRCRCLIAPDSGILAMAYFLNTSFPLRIVSLWADPNHGILKQNVSSPNPLLEHIPIISPNKKNAALISPAHVQEAVVHPLLKEQRALLHSPPVITSYPPVTTYATPQASPFKHKVASLILVGGQGSRLLTSEPKALVPVTAVCKKTLLQLLCEKTLAASHAYNTPLPLALMTSPYNYSRIKSYLEEHHYFGLPPDHVDLFVQETAPFLNDQESWFLDSAGKIATGPDGNGHCFKLLVQSGVAKKWQNQGVEMVSVLPIDNPLADPFDAALFGYHAESGHEVTIKSILRQDHDEKVGLLVYKNGRICVQEYSEAIFPNTAPLAYINLLALSLPFIQRIATCTLPWHLARKKYEGQMVWKFERFIFDILPFSNHTGVLVYPREETYAPLKNHAGESSLATVQQALLNYDRHLMGKLTELPLPDRPFELDPKFYYPTPQLKAAWKNRALPPDNYIV